MIEIQFSENEAKELVDFYTKKIEEASQKVDLLKNTLTKLQTEHGKETPAIKKSSVSNPVINAPVAKSSVAKTTVAKTTVEKAPVIKTPVVKTTEVKTRAKKASVVAPVESVEKQKRKRRTKAEMLAAKNGIASGGTNQNEVVKRTRAKKATVAPIATTKTTAKVKTTKVAAPKAAKSDGGLTWNKPNWTVYVLNKIIEENRPMQSNEITQTVIHTFNVPLSDKEKVRTSVAGCLTKLESVEKKVKSYFKDGVRARYYALTEWFNNDNLKAEYAEKI